MGWSSLCHSEEQATEDIGLYINANKTEYMCFKQGAISTLSSRPLKLVDLFIYLSSNISSENDANICLVKA